MYCERIWKHTCQLTKAQGIAEELKGCDQMAWVGAMNTLKVQAEEIVVMDGIVLMEYCNYLLQGGRACIAAFF